MQQAYVSEAEPQEQAMGNDSVETREILSIYTVKLHAREISNVTYGISVSFGISEGKVTHGISVGFGISKGDINHGIPSHRFG